MANQWPELSELPKTKTVRSVLIEEGSGVAERTNNIVQFVVETERGRRSGFTYKCYLHVPNAAYRYPFLSVEQEGLDYPVVIYADNWPQGGAAGNERAFRENLGLVFRSDAVKRLLVQLVELGG